MTMQKVEDASEVIVGNFYLVPCLPVKDKFYRGMPGTGVNNAWFPVLGTRHTDAEIGFPWLHYHPDWRFSKDGWPSDMSHVVNLPDGDIGGVAQDIQPVYRRLKCRRNMPVFPRASHALEAEYVGREVECGKCPHRGHPLHNLPKDARGFLVCPGHGLQVNTHTQTVTPRILDRPYKPSGWEYPQN